MQAISVNATCSIAMALYFSIHFSKYPEFQTLLRVVFTPSVASKSTGRECRPVTSLNEKRVVILIG